MRRLALAFVLVVSLARPAHADLAGAVYDDVRDVIEELIRSEVTTSVVRAIEERSPALAFYLHGTLERLGSPYWGSLGRALRQDLTVTVADFVYWHLSSGGGSDVVASAQKFFGCVKNPHGDAACQRLVTSIRDQHRPLLESECRRVKPLPERRVACDVGLATLAALEQRSTVRHHVLDALADVVLYEIDDRGEYDRLADLLTSWLDRPTEVPQNLLETIGDPDLEKMLTNDAIDKLCSDPAKLEAFLKSPADDPGWICFAVSHSSLPGALGATVTIEEGDHKLKARIDYWNIQAALKDFDPINASDDNSFRLLSDMVFEARCPPGAATEGWPCKGPRLQPGATITVEWLGKTIAGTIEKTGLASTKPKKGMMLWLLRFRKAIKRIEELRALVPQSLQKDLFFPGNAPGDTRQMLRSIARMARLVSELRARWYLWTQNAGPNPGSASVSELDVAELLHVARMIVGTNDGTNNALGFLDQNGGGGASKIDIGDWMRLVMRGDYRSLAMESLRAALDLRYDDESRPRETFFLTLAAYLLDAGEGVNEQVARSAFKAAAKDLLAATEHVGIPSAAHRWRVRALPRIAMRLSFAEDYAATGGDTRRTVVAADWPTAMIALSDYFGFEGSLLDPVAPLAELALRPSGTYREQSYVALDALRPRLGMWVAMPALSKRLTLSTGFAARFVHLVREPQMDPTLVVGRYSAQTSLVFDLGVQLVF